VKCEKGEFAPFYAEECEVCPTGYLAHHKGMDSIYACPIGRFGLFEGASSLKYCKECPAGERRVY
jgi:hypothetical protein